jgi:DNA-binding response OmpR family regulator
MPAKIMLIEGKHADHDSFASGLNKKGFQVVCFPNGGAALERLVNVDPDLVVVDAASLRTSGKRIVQSLRHGLERMPIVLVVDKNQESIDASVADVVLVLPFTVQKLVNRIRGLLPPEEKDLMHVGPVRLNLESKQVRCLGKQARLTPRLVILLKTLMEHTGEVVSRENLFRLVWETEYTGDTRTLDVHISWLRQAMESDPRHPRFLKTVRGVGYRLDI